MLVALFILSLSLVAAEAECIRGLPDAHYLTSMAVEIVTNTSHDVTYSTQYLFTSFEFNCSGAITGWTMLAMSGSGKGRVELSVWTPSGGSQLTKKAGLLMDACPSEEEVVEGTGVYLHHGRTTDQSLQFQPGDVLGMLTRLKRSSNYSPLMVEEDHNTGFTTVKNGPYPDDFELPGGSRPSTNKKPLFSVRICIEGPEASETYPNCSTIDLPDSSCPSMTITTSSLVASMSPSLSISPTPSVSPSSPSTFSSPPTTLILIVAIAVPCVLVLLVLVIVLGVCVIWCMRSGRTDKVEITPQQTQPPSSLPMLSYDTPFPALNGDPATHTYETPLDRPRPSVTISCGDITDSSDAAVIVNHTRSGSHAEASVYEEPLVSVPQYESILGAQHQNMYDALTSPESSQPPVFSRHNSPHLLPSHSLYATPHYYHTLEKPRSPSPSPPQNRHSGKAMSPLVTRARGAPYSSGDSAAQKRMNMTSSTATGCDDDELAAGYQIITSNSNIKLNSGIYVPTHQQRSLFCHEPIFDDNIYADLSRNAPNSPLSHNWSFFIENDHYWKPSSDKVQLYHQLHTNKYREINRKQIEIIKHLGSGEFGTVCKGFWHTNSGSLEVAVKMIQNKVSEENKVRFLQEAAILGQFQHANIVRLHGVVTVSDPVMILLELMKKGDLKNYLQSLQPAPGEMVQPELQGKLLRFCSEVALGLEYLAKKNFVHRDISARNILLSEDLTCKIADFGMSRDLDEQDYYLANGGMIPFKWTSPEALHYRKYSSASDVWSYGVLLWEIWSLGQTPYKDCQTPDEATALVNSGARLLPPPGCPRAIYKLMMECWDPKPIRRLTFTDIVKLLHVPSSQLLDWSQGDEEAGQGQARCLGASPEAGHCLYPDLQVMYTKISV